MPHMTRTEEKRTIAIRLRTLQERAIAFPEQKALFDEMASELSAYLDQITLEEKRMAQLQLFEVKGESDETPKRYLTMMNVMGIA